MTFVKLVACVFFGSMVLGVVSTTKPQSQHSERPAVVEKASTSDFSCASLGLRMRETTKDMEVISTRAFENANAIQDFVTNHDIALLRKLVRSSREDVSTARYMMVRASSQLDEAINHGCSTEVQAADARQKLARMSDQEDKMLSFLNEFQDMLDKSSS